MLIDPRSPEAASRLLARIAAAKQGMSLSYLAECLKRGSRAADRDALLRQLVRDGFAESRQVPLPLVLNRFATCYFATDLGRDYLKENSHVASR